jgi:hypothetical protein
MVLHGHRCGDGRVDVMGTRPGLLEERCKRWLGCLVALQSGDGPGPAGRPRHLDAARSRLHNRSRSAPCYRVSQRGLGLLRILDRSAAGCVTPAYAPGASWDATLHLLMISARDANLRKHDRRSDTTAGAG